MCSRAVVWLWSVRAKRGREGEDCSLEINQSKEKEKESGKKAGKGGKKGTSIHAVAVTVAIASISFTYVRFLFLALFFLCF